jgi:hypothetical protein
MSETKPPGPPSIPKCRHGLAFTMIGWCQECESEDIEIKKLTNPLIDEYWESKGREDLYHIVYRAYRMGMRNEHDKG